MHDNKNNEGGNIWPSNADVEWVGPNKEKNRAEWERVKNQPSAQLGSSSSTSASSSKGKDKK